MQAGTDSQTICTVTADGRGYIYHRSTTNENRGEGFTLGPRVVSAFHSENVARNREQVIVWRAPGRSDLTCQPVGLADIAERLGVARQTAAMWNYRKLLPVPKWTVSGQPCWNWPDIQKWAEQTHRA